MDTTATSSSRLGYVAGLDGLRGVAIAAVVGYHAFGYPLGGWIGVDLFFVLSGFLITTLLLEERAATGTIGLRAFYVRRARRLLPALGVLLAGYLAICALKGVDGLGNVARWGLYTGNAYEAFWRGASTHLVGLNHLWSLAEEEQFYLVWPFVLLLVCKARNPLLLLSAIAAALMLYRLGLADLGASDARVYFAPDTNLDGFVVGAALAFRRRRGPIGVSRRLVTAAVVLGVLVGAAIPSTAILDAVALPLVELSAVVSIAAVVGGVVRLPRPLVWLGTISYSLYLWHSVVLWALDWRHPLLGAGLAIAAAWASTVLVERPFRRRRRAGALRPATAPAPGF